MAAHRDRGAFFLAPLVYNAFGGVQVAFSWHAIWLAAIVLEVAGVVWLLACFVLPEVGENEKAQALRAGEEANAGARAGESAGSSAAARDGAGGSRRDYVGSALIACFSFAVVTYLYVGNYNTFYRRSCRTIAACP